MKKLLLLLLLPFAVFSQGPLNCVPTTLVINLDQYQSETYWNIKGPNGNVIASVNSGAYGGQPDYAVITELLCLPQGPLTFTIYDTYGDGLAGSKLKTAVTGKVKPGSKAAKRRKSFCARSKGWTGERGKAARRRWKC